MTHYSAELVRRCEERGMRPAVARAAQALGMAIDAGIVSLPALLDLVRSCSTADELGDALVMLATTAQLQPAGGAQ